jgi:hypothetical protein
MFVLVRCCAKKKQLKHCKSLDQFLHSAIRQICTDTSVIGQMHLVVAFHLSFGFFAFVTVSAVVQLASCVAACVASGHSQFSVGSCGTQLRGDADFRSCAHLSF